MQITAKSAAETHSVDHEICSVPHDLVEQDASAINHQTSAIDRKASAVDCKASALDHEANGVHLLLTLKNCSSAILNDAEKLSSLAHNAALATGATVLEVLVHKFQPQGTTVLVVLAESHASLHTYPESNTLFWDCFTCGPSCRPELSEAVLVEALIPESVNRQVIERR